jgi:hypothetical protein
MKKLLTGAAFLFTFSGINAQNKIEAPAVVKAAFAKEFPSIIDVKWEKEKSDYEAGFTVNGEEMSAVFNSKGTLKEKEVEIKVTDLPAAVMAYVKEHYKGAKVKEAAKITKANGEVNYEAEVNGKDVLFTEKGAFLKEAKD